MSTQSQPFHHALRIRQEVCVGCSRCMHACPTEALRVVGGKAKLNPGWCVDCGECYKVCPVRAIVVEDDDISQIFNYKHRILLIPAVFFAQFEEKLSLEAINGILYKMGFTELCTVEQGVDLLVDELNKYVAAHAKNAPVLSSYCPAVVRLIQNRFPGLTPQVMRLAPPLEITAQYFRNYYKKQGEDLEDVGIFYVTPCAAKIAAIKAPVGGYESPINGVINMNHLYNKVYWAYKQNQGANSNCIPVHSSLSSVGISWCTTGGESAHVKGRSLAVDGMPNVIEILDRLENDELEDVDFLELRACDVSCAGGILTHGNRFLIKNRIDKMAQELPRTHGQVEAFREMCANHLPIQEIEPRTMVKYHSDLSIALERMEEASRLRKCLPNIDCGACGAPSCEALANDIVCGRATKEQCLLLDAHKTSPQKVERIWGFRPFQHEND